MVIRPIAALLLMLGTSSMSTAEVFSHDDWTTVLQEYVDDRGWVDYDGLSRDRAALDRYLSVIESTSPRSHPDLFPDADHELAYWINAYNAWVFKGVLDRGPEQDSVWKGGLISGYGFFVKMKIRVGGEQLNLKRLEDDWIRAEYGDPRIHAALNCASVGCPDLPRVAFTGDSLEQELDSAMRLFVSQERNVAVDGEDRVELSKIFDWFEKDFLGFERSAGRSDPTLIGYVNRFREEGKQIPEDSSVRFIPYDKGINAQRPAS